MADFDSKKFVDINKGDLDIKMTDEEKAKINKTETDYDPLMKWITIELGSDRVKEVKISNRLTDSPAVLVQSDWGMSPTMQRYMRATASARGEDDKYSEVAMKNQAILEINPDQAIIKKLKEAHGLDPTSKEAKDLVNLVYEIAALTGGYRIDDPAAFAKRVTSMVSDKVSR